MSRTPKSGLPARPGLRPAWRGCVLPCVARPLPGDAFAAWRDFNRAGRRWAGQHTSGLPARSGLCPAGRGCALRCVARPFARRRLRRPSHHCPRRPALGPEPKRVGSRTEPGLARQAGAAPARPPPASLGPCLATPPLPASRLTEWSTEWACAQPSAIHVCHLPEAGFAQRRGAEPSPAPLGPCPATPSPPGAPRPRRRALGRTPLHLQVRESLICNNR